MPKVTMYEHPYVVRITGVKQGVEVIHVKTGLMCECDEYTSMQMNRKKAIEAIGQELNRCKL